MENVKYIPGDLVMTNGVPIGTKKGVVYRVVASKPNRTETFKSGKVLKGVVTLDNADEKGRGKGYLLVESGAWVKDIVPIPLTPAILEANGWIKNPFGEGGFIERYTQNGLTLFIYHTEDDEWICRIGDYDVKIKLVHQLQHILFGLGLDSSLKV